MILIGNEAHFTFELVSGDFLWRTLTSGELRQLLASSVLNPNLTFETKSAESSCGTVIPVVAVSVKLNQIVSFVRNVLEK